ncbi:TPA: ATP-binding protein, partial [Pasteurella multocida]|nr:ATP-binding protein [Pasteurella multocida]
NTISAGEDNLLILLTAIYSLKHYYKTTDGMNSILLIDELDATLHPSLQYEIFYLLKELSQEYGVQVFFTTHSLSLLDLAIKNHANITYLIDEVDSVYPMEKPDIRKIKLFLEKKTQASLYENNKIPLMTEDKEARE